MSKTKTIKTLAVALMAILLLGFGASYWTLNSEKAPDSSAKAEADAIAHIQAEELAKRVQELDISGYVGLRVSPDLRTADLWLSEEQSPQLLGQIGAPKGFTVTLRNSPHTKAQLERAISKINSLVQSYEIPGGVVLSSSAHREDGAGIDLTIDKTSKVPDDKWVQDFSDYLGIPVFVDPEKTNIRLGSTRIQDSAPWRGGSLFATKGASGKTVYCSRGFGVISKVTKIQYMLAARHCFENQNQILRTLSNKSTMGFWMPKPYYNSASDDVSLTIPSGGVVRNSVYYGNLTTSTARQVIAVGANTVGLRVCTNGANSGLHCNVVIRRGPHQVYAGNIVYENVVTGSKDNKQIVVSQGDSGGPVVSQVNSSGTLKGYGIIHSLSAAGNCADFGVRVNVGPTSCGQKVYWIDLSSVLADLHVNLK